VKYSNDNGTNWTTQLKINTDNTTTSQFFPRIAVDQTSGKVAVSWYDCRADLTTNALTRFYAAVSSDGGVTFTPSNLQLEPGQSDTLLSTGYYNSSDYMDYTALAYYGGYFYSAWADNSCNPTNADSGGVGMDRFVTMVRH